MGRSPRDSRCWFQTDRLETATAGLAIDYVIDPTTRFNRLLTVGLELDEEGLLA